MYVVVKVGFGRWGNLQILWRCNREKWLTVGHIEYRGFIIQVVLLKQYYLYTQYVIIAYGFIMYKNTKEQTVSNSHLDLLQRKYSYFQIYRYCYFHLE